MLSPRQCQWTLLGIILLVMWPALATMTYELSVGLSEALIGWPVRYYTPDVLAASWTDAQVWKGTVILVYVAIIPRLARGWKPRPSA